MSGHHANIEKWRQRAVCHPDSEESSGSAGKSRAYRQERTEVILKELAKANKLLAIELGLW